jgi:hypothetical protein
MLNLKTTKALGLEFNPQLCFKCSPGIDRVAVVEKMVE